MLVTTACAIILSLMHWNAPSKIPEMTIAECSRMELNCIDTIEVIEIQMGKLCALPTKNTRLVDALGM